MYSGGVLMILATPLALGSLWAFVCAVLLCGVIAARLLDEERFLSRNLPDKAGLPHQGWLTPRRAGCLVSRLGASKFFANIPWSNVIA
jgi:hypothetical protein